MGQSHSIILGFAHTVCGIIVKLYVPNTAILVVFFDAENLDYVLSNGKKRLPHLS